jgi:hypothetical protein
MSDRIETLDELIDLFAFGDVHEASCIFRDDPDVEWPAVRLPYLRNDKSGNTEIDAFDEARDEFVALLIAFREGRLGKGGHVLPKTN